MLGWSISGQTCLDLTDGAIHVQAKRTCVVTGEDPYMPLTGDLITYSRPAPVAHTETNTEEEYEIVQCPNKFDFRESNIKHSDDNRTAEDVYCVTRNDNDVGLSIEDRRFVEIMERGIRKNELGN